MTHRTINAAGYRGEGFVLPSTGEPRYLQDAAGRPFIPVGLNLCFPRFWNGREDGLAKMKRWIDRLSENGGNFARLFLGHPFFDVEHDGYGTHDEERESRIAEVVEYAWIRGIRLKLTLELFRTIDVAPQAELFPGAVNFSRPFYYKALGGEFQDMTDFLQSEAGRRHFLGKVDRLACRFANHPGVIGLDLWNEMNAVSGRGWEAWTQEMLLELKKRFPNHLVSQTLGSLDGAWAQEAYRKVISMPGNELAQVHRYLDLGTEDRVCHGPVDVMMADAVTTLLELAPSKPALLAEGGAVEPNHARPWDLYKADTEGIVLHDVLFAPFFAGACGSGQPWHWKEYVDANGLWWHFARFRRAIEGIDPVRGRFAPRRRDRGRLRIYALEGESEGWYWCRDSRFNWQTELVEHLPADLLRNEELRISDGGDSEWTAETYAPWDDADFANISVDGGRIVLPPFRRSIVVRCRRRQGGWVQE